MATIEEMMDAVAHSFGLETPETVGFFNLCETGDIEAIENRFTELSDMCFDEEE